MQTGLVLGTGRYELREVEDPTLLPNSAIAAISMCGICGSDIGAFKHGDDSPFKYPPAVCGHEWMGVIKEIDCDIDLNVGDRVIFSAPPPCGVHCAACRQGQYHACSNIVSAFFGQDGFSPGSGGFAPLQRVDPRRLVRIPETISELQGAMAEPAAVAAHCVRQSGLVAGDRVVIIGAGAIGLFVLQFAKAAGAQQIIVIEPSPERQRAARQLGASYVCAPGQEAIDCLSDVSRGLGADQVFECAGLASTIQSASTFVRQRGFVNILGISGVSAAIDTDSWIVKEIAVRTSLGFGKADTESVLKLMESGAIDVSEMHSATVGLDELGGTIADLAKGGGGIKVMVDPRL